MPFVYGIHTRWRRLFCPLVFRSLCGMCQTNMVVGLNETSDGLLFGVNEKLLTQHYSGPVTKYNLL